MNKATRDQLELMAALGVFKGEDITEDEASGLIDEAKSRGLEPDWDKKQAAAPQITRIMKHRAALPLKMKRRAAKALKIAKAQDYMPSIVNNLEADLARWTAEIEHFKTIKKKDRKDYLEFWHARMTDDPDFEQLGYSTHLKNPTIEQIDKVLRKLDRQQPDWDDSSVAGHFVYEEEYVFQALIRKFPRLRQENGESSHLTEVYENAQSINLLQSSSPIAEEQNNVRPLARTVRTVSLILACCVIIVVIYALINS